MKTSSAKAKGRRLQQLVRDDLRKIAPQLDPTDIESTPMGVNGVDVVLTAAARKVFGELAIECKNVEVLNAVGVFQGHLDKYRPKGKIALMVHSRNHIEPRVTLLWSDFVRLYLTPVIQGSVSGAPSGYRRAVAMSPVLGAPYAGAPQPRDPYSAFARCPICGHDNHVDEHCGGPWHPREDD